MTVLTELEAKGEANVWLITGTSTGFGRHLVFTALARGDRVVATARNLDKIQDFPKSDHLRLLQLDVDDGPVAIKAKIDEGAAIWGRIDVLVNNAGTGMKGLLEEGGSELLKKQFQTNLFGMLDVTTAALPHMRARRSGTVVLIGSRTSDYFCDSQTDMISSWKGIYASSKAALRSNYVPFGFLIGFLISWVQTATVGIGETLSVELAEFSIRVLIVEPAAFRTEGILSYPYYEDNPISDYDAMRKASKARYDSAEPHMTGDPAKAMEVLADIVRYLCNPVQYERSCLLTTTSFALGKLCDTAIREKCNKVCGVLDDWQDVILDLDLDKPC